MSEALLRAAAERQEEWVSLLGEIVDIDSGPGDHEGIGRVYDVLERELTPLGFTVDRLPTPGPDLLVARRPGGVDGARRLALIGHADTVFPAGTAAERPFRREGERLRGPGVADMKGGLVVAIAGLALAGKDVLDQLDLTVIVNGDEESGSAESRETIERLAPDFDVALVFEPGRPSDGFVVSRRGAHRFDVAVTGRPAHTGVNPHEGANAIETAAHHVLAIQELGRQTPDATVTAVLVSGGSRPNIVPEHARIRVDSRFDHDEAEAAVVAGIRALAGPGPVPGTTTAVTSLDRRPAFQARPEARFLADLVLSVGAELGMDLSGEPTGGSSDGNFTSAAGVPTIDGLGAVGHDYHTPDEYVLAASVSRRAALLGSLLAKLAIGRS
ncbi:MAG TPA: M20 family metallopeptidase [Acidimicrobiia bacterium]|nr:M20 family metallopeptidase [Acidimicrobiia bacterium]